MDPTASAQNTETWRKNLSSPSPLSASPLINLLDRCSLGVREAMPQEKLRLFGPEWLLLLLLLGGGGMLNANLT